MKYNWLHRLVIPALSRDGVDVTGRDITLIRWWFKGEYMVRFCFFKGRTTLFLKPLTSAMNQYKADKNDERRAKHRRAIRLAI